MVWNYFDGYKLLISIMKVSDQYDLAINCRDQIINCSEAGVSDNWWPSTLSKRKKWALTWLGKKCGLNDEATNS